MKYYFICLLFGFPGYSLASGGNITSKILPTAPTSRFMYDLMVTLLKTCDLNTRKIIIFDDTFKSETFSAIAEIRPQISALLFSDWNAILRLRRDQFDDLELDAVIFVIKPNYAWFRMKFFFLRWRYNRNCLVYMIPVPITVCTYWKSLFEWLMRFYFPNAYYICVRNNQYIRAYTQDPYGDANPPYWENIYQEKIGGKNWNFYARSPITSDMEMSELCPGFNFKRTDPNHQTTVITGIREYQIGPNFVEGIDLYGAEIEKDFKQPHRARIQLLKRLLKLQFKYYKISTTTKAFDTTDIDLILLEQAIPTPNIFTNIFHPLEYEPFVIITHDRGLMTPIEKIAKFYGIWTLSSLIVMLSITFIVIKTVTKNSNLAFFDSIRLLINIGIMIPINTRPLKIFFCMVFLYFMVIHATFSGNLAGFLTKLHERSNAETLEDLKDPRIEKIYNFGYWYNWDNESDVLWAKSIFLIRSDEFVDVINEKTCAYIAPLVVSDMVWTHMKGNNTLYTSKNTFGISFISSSYRSGFPLSKKFDWAFMYLFDTGLISQMFLQHRWTVVKAIARQNAETYFHHRPITLGDIYFAFILLTVGNGVSFICFLVEINLKNVSEKFRNLRRNKSRHIVRFEIQPY